MGLNSFFTCPQVIERHHSGILGGFQDGFCEWLINKQYSKSIIYNYIPHITHLSCFLSKQGLENFHAIKESHIYDYFEQPFSTNFLKTAHHAYRCFLAYLKEQDIILITPVQAAYQGLIEQYSQWCESYRDLSEATIHLRCQYLIGFIDKLGEKWFIDDLSLITAEQIRVAFINYSENKGVPWRRSMASTLRSFFQFCYIKGLNHQPISIAIPRISSYKLSTIPKGIAEQDALALLASVDRTSGIGKRNYAILILLYYYGVRNAQVRTLRLQDIDWQQETILFKALKFGNPVLLPLIEEVGNALFDYLRHARPESDYKEIFLTDKAPYHPFYRQTNINSVIFEQAAKAGLKLPSKGSHMFRHGFATRMVNRASSLKSIADILGHKCLETTLQYSKVDFIALNKVPLEFPI
jgi:site-specific recombinase XerD